MSYYTTNDGELAYLNQVQLLCLPWLFVLSWCLYLSGENACVIKFDDNVAGLDSNP